MEVKPVHFGDRLRQVRIELFETQAKMAEWMHKEGVLRKPNQTTVQNWEKSDNFSRAVLEKLAILKKKGVNPDYFINPLITDWHGPALVEWDEGMIGALKDRVNSLTTTIVEIGLARDRLLLEMDRLRKENEDLKRQIEELRK